MMGPVWMRGAGLALGLCVAALIACDGSSPVERGFGSRQLLSIRDSTVSLGSWWGSDWLYQRGGDFWSLDLDTGETHDLGPLLPDLNLPDRNRGIRYECSVEGIGSVFTLMVTDSQTGVTTRVGIDSSGWTCPRGDDPRIEIWRRDDAGGLALWVGPYDQLAPVPIDLVIPKTIIYAVSGTGGALPSFRIFGALPAQPDQVGVFEIAPPDFVPKTIVPPVLANAAWAEGATPVGPPLASTSVRQSLFTSAGDGQYIYERAMSDGGVTMFLGPLPLDPSELALFRAASPTVQLQSVPLDIGRWSTFTETIWQAVDVAAATATLFTWSPRWQRLVACPTLPAPDPSPVPPPLSAISSPDRNRIAVFASHDPYGIEPRTGGPLLLMGAVGCTTLASADVTAFTFSPDSSAMAWLVQPPSGDATLWSAGADGSAPRKIGTGDLAGPPSQPTFLGPSELQFQLAGDLAWVDVHDDPVRLHYIAEKVFGTATDIGGWVVIGDELSRQDESGTLSLVDPQSGARRMISREVEDYVVLGMAPTSPLMSPPDATLDNGPVRILYKVRGRNPSSQDGIWIATVTAADLP